MARDDDNFGLYLGLGDHGTAWSGRERSTLVLGPSRSGKTSSLVVPNILTARGATVSTSTKPDVLMATASARRRVGWTMLFDPSGSVDVPRGVLKVGWSPLNAAFEWDGALAIADAMVRAARGDNRGARASDGDHWRERASSLLAPVLHAAAISSTPMGDVLSWVDRHDGARALKTLDDAHADPAASDVLAGILATDEREQSGIWSTASGVLSAYRSRSAIESTKAPYLDVSEFCSQASTLYVCAPGRSQQLLAPLVVGLLCEITDAAYERARTHGPDPPVVFALDEVANIAPLPDLPAIVSEGAGQGLLTLACLQDLSQARSRWGRDAEGFLSLFGTTVVLPGIADIATLQALSTLAGEVTRPVQTLGVSEGNRRRLTRSVSTTIALRKRLPPDVIARGVAGLAMALDAGANIGWVKLTPFFDRLLEAPRRVGRDLEPFSRG
ncbi:MAG: type IV secretory system conjugative DNA transfer family protein [Acidimicrobiales bacterium]